MAVRQQGQVTCPEATQAQMPLQQSDAGPEHTAWKLWLQGRFTTVSDAWNRS